MGNSDPFATFWFLFLSTRIHFPSCGISQQIVQQYLLRFLFFSFCIIILNLLMKPLPSSFIPLSWIKGSYQSPHNCYFSFLCVSGGTISTQLMSLLPPAQSMFFLRSRWGIFNFSISAIFKTFASVCLAKLSRNICSSNRSIPRNILKSLVNIYVDDAIVYGCTSKNQYDQSLVSDLSSDLALAERAQLGKTSWSYSMLQKTNYWHYIITKRAMNFHLLWWSSVFSGMPCALSTY